MHPMKIIGIVLIVLGVAALVYGGFTQTKEHDAQLGPVEVSIEEKERVEIPIWASVGAIALGVVLLVVKPKSS